MDATITKLHEMIYRRKSVRSYTGQPVDAATLAQIEAFIQTMKPLYGNIKVKSEFIDKSAVVSMFPWVTPQVVAIFSEEQDGAMENVGFLYQQLDLYLQSIGLGSCWLGVGRLNEKKVVARQAEDALQYVLMMSFGYSKDTWQREDALDFRRKSLAEIADQVDERLEPARLAPSSMNSQPWYFVHDKDVLHIYCAQKGVAKAKRLNRIDIGIALAHLYVSNPDTFRFFHAEFVPERKGYSYIGSVVL